MAEDELEPLITECPNCSTRFRVTESQLQVASGRVRCGACLTVFHGIEFLVWDDADAYASEAEARDALDQLLDELNEEAGTAENRAGEAGELADLTALGADPIADPESPASAKFWEEDTRQFYAGHEDDLAAQADVQAQPVGEPAGGPFGEELADEINAEPAADADAVPDEGEWVDDEPLEVSPSSSAGMQLAAGELDENVDLTGVPQTADVDTSDAGGEDDTPDAGAPLEDVGMEVPEDNAGAVRNRVGARLIDLPEDLSPAAEISFAPEPRRWWIGVVVLLGVLVLGGQVFWFQFERWGRDPAMRPAYAYVCELVGCQLPVLRDLQLLETSQLMVRSNPEMAGALIVDVVIVNQAQFAQPFPVLELRFTTIDGSLVAGRRFQPAEYLAGELASATEMDPMTPVRIELEIEDPGGDAVNYFLSFR